MNELTPKPENNNIIPAVALRESVVFPHTEVPLTFGRARSNSAVKAAFAGSSEKQIAIFAQKDFRVENPNVDEIYQVGTLATVENILEVDGSVMVLVRGLKRIEIEEVIQTEPFLLVKVKEVKEEFVESDKTKALLNQIINGLRKAFSLGKQLDFFFLRLLTSRDVTPSEITDQVSSIIDLKIDDRQELLQMTDVNKRLVKIAQYLEHELKILELEQSIASKTKARFEKEMKETILREQKRTIEKELGEEEDELVLDYKKRIKDAGMPQDVKKKAEKELERYAAMPGMSPERPYIENYLDWLISMPWNNRTPNNVSLTTAAKILDSDHYGMKKAKERIIEFLAVMKLKKKEETKEKKALPTGKQEEGISAHSILCFMGPPGVGKTSIGKSIAKALGRKFIRISLGGIRDEAEIRGHRRTYVGALPGRIVQGIKDAGVRNPVFMLDEIDKMGIDFRGDPSSALLEALDPEQNNSFSDHYLEVPFDLSDVLFVCTGNVLDTIPEALRDRLEIISFPGYTEDEKFRIAKKYLWPKQLKANAIKQKIELTDEALSQIICRYTREAGVRELERMMATICRKLARKLAENKKAQSVIKITDLQKFLGACRYSSTIAETKDEVGMSTGLAWTEAGGQILFIEVALMPGRGQLILTGHLGEVMKESCQAAMSYVKSHWKELGLVQNFAKNLDVHVHVPEGAVPKDGPSAGAAMTTALVSAFTKVPIRKEVGMTGEITLRGRVLEIGGVKEKVIAAQRAGLKTIILPKDNKKDLEDVPASIKKEIKFVFVSNLDQVLKIALNKKAETKKKTVKTDILRRTVSPAIASS